MICSICHKPIGDMCQVHYGDDGGPICTRCLGMGAIEIVQPGPIIVGGRLLEVGETIADAILYDHVGEW